MVEMVYYVLLGYGEMGRVKGLVFVCCFGYIGREACMGKGGYDRIGKERVYIVYLLYMVSE